MSVNRQNIKVGQRLKHQIQNIIDQYEYKGWYPAYIQWLIKYSNDPIEMGLSSCLVDNYPE